MPASTAVALEGSKHPLMGALVSQKLHGHICSITWIMVAHSVALAYLVQGTLTCARGPRQAAAVLQQHVPRTLYADY